VAALTAEAGLLDATEGGRRVGHDGAVEADHAVLGAVGGRDRLPHVIKDHTRLPGVGHLSRPWETEPLRWLGANAGLQAMSLADRAEARSGRPSRLAQLAGRFLGG